MYVRRAAQNMAHSHYVGVEHNVRRRHLELVLAERGSSAYVMFLDRKIMVLYGVSP